MGFLPSGTTQKLDRALTAGHGQGLGGEDSAGSFAVAFRHPALRHLELLAACRHEPCPGPGAMPRTQLWMWSALSVSLNSAISLLSMGATEAFSWA